jgi:hypothetical protein
VDEIIREEISRKGAKPQRREKFLNLLGFLGGFAPLREAFFDLFHFGDFVRTDGA